MLNSFLLRLYCYPAVFNVSIDSKAKYPELAINEIGTEKILAGIVNHTGAVNKNLIPR